MTKDAAQDARDYSVSDSAEQDDDLDASASADGWIVVVASPSRICTALLKAGKTAGVISAIRKMTDQAVVDPTKRDRMALGRCDAVIVSGAYDDTRARTFAASALRTPTIFIADQDEPAHENNALAAGAHTAMLARDCTPSSLRSALQNAKVAFDLQRRWVEGEGRLERAVQTVAAARRDRLAFLNHIGHEFRTPLNAIIGFVDVLAQRAEAEGAVIDDTMRKYLAHVCDSGGDMLALVEDLMLLAHSESLAATVLRPCAAADLVADCHGAVQESMSSQSTAFRQSSVTSGHVRCDTSMISQTMRALAREAIAFGPTEVTVIAKRAGAHLEVGVACPKGWVDPESGISQAGPWPKAAALNRDLSLALALADSVALLHGGSLVLDTTEDAQVFAGIALPLDSV
ncbi:MAG: HAMP domain-containing histidine kinase [Alphaproteobacteria bacterium]|nr:HAMP domain-containing histidine kinase [Alphaproteobacteria bacterium]